MKKSIKSLFNFLFIALIMTSCDLNGLIGGNNAELFEKYETATELVCREISSVDGKSLVDKSTYFEVINDEIYGYSEYTINNTNISKEISNVKEYIDGEDICFSYNNSFAETKLESNSVINFIGLDSIFKSAKKKPISNSIISGQIDASNCIGLVKSFLMNTGNFKDNPSNFTFNSTISYSIFINEQDNSIELINLDLSSCAKLKNSSVSEFKTFIEFDLNTDVSGIIASNPYPTDKGNSDISKEKNIKEKGLEFIKDCYEDVRYVNNDLYFYTNTIVSPKLSFTYKSSNPNVIGDDGKYYEVDKDVAVTITVTLLYSSKEYNNYSFSFLAIPVVESSGELGTIANPLYKGRKEINNVEIHFIEMHQQYGDSVYIKAGDFDMLIDAGQVNDGGYVNDVLRRNVSDGKLECVIATHAHGDHIGGMLTALSTIKNITYAVDYGYQRSDYSVVQSVRNKFEQAEKYAPITDCINGLNGAKKVLYITKDFYITFLETGYYEEPSVIINNSDFNFNLTSVALILTFKNQNYYFAGDLETEAENRLVNNNQVFKVDLAKASHHGSSTSNSNNILKVLKPSAIVVTTALVKRGDEKNNAASQYHPNGNVLSRMLGYSKVYVNFTTGTLKVTCDGNNEMNFAGEGPVSPYYMYGSAVTGEENMEFRYTKYAQQYYRKYI